MDWLCKYVCGHPEGPITHNTEADDVCSRDRTLRIPDSSVSALWRKCSTSLKILDSSSHTLASLKYPET